MHVLSTSVHQCPPWLSSCGRRAASECPFVSWSHCAAGTIARVGSSSSFCWLTIRSSAASCETYAGHATVSFEADCPPLHERRALTCERYRTAGHLARAFVHGCERVTFELRLCCQHSYQQHPTASNSRTRSSLSACAACREHNRSLLASSPPPLDHLLVAVDHDSAEHDRFSVARVSLPVALPPT